MDMIVWSKFVNLLYESVNTVIGRAGIFACQCVRIVIAVYAKINNGKQDACPTLGCCGNRSAAPLWRADIPSPLLHKNS
jgi:hypothetical protein